MHLVCHFQSREFITVTKYIQDQLPHFLMTLNSLFLCACIARCHTNLIVCRNMSPITGFSYSLGQAIGPCRAHGLHLQDTVVGAHQALAIMLIDVVVMHHLEAKAHIPVMSCNTIKRCTDYSLLAIETTLCAKVSFENGSRNLNAMQQSHGAYQLIGNNQLEFRICLIHRLSVIPSDHSEISIGAYGLNFREVLHMLGMVSMPDGVGVEGAGVITKVGYNAGTSIGSHVFGWIGSDFSNYAIAHTKKMVFAPQSMSFVEAATIFTCWLTVNHAFGHLCSNISFADTALVHAATGSVGIAAIRSVQWEGGTVIATAGRDRKRMWLLQQGVHMVSCSRKPEQLLLDLGGWFGPRKQSLRVVLNSLSNEFIGIGFQHLGVGSSFIEIGKREIWDVDKAVNYRVDVNYLPMDESVMAPHSHSLGVCLEQGVASGICTSIPVQVFTARTCSDAFQYLRAASHIGKV